MGIAKSGTGQRQEKIIVLRLTQFKARRQHRNRLAKLTLPEPKIHLGGQSDILDRLREPERTLSRLERPLIVRLHYEGRCEVCRYSREARLVVQDRGKALRLQQVVEYLLRLAGHEQDISE